MWDPDVSSGVFPVVASPSARDALFSRLRRVKAPSASVNFCSDRRNVLIGDGGKRLQLCIRTVASFGRDTLLTEAVLPSAARLAAYRCFNVFVEEGRLPKHFFLCSPRSSRFQLALQALDGSVAGVRHRDIAEALFGAVRVARDWSDPREHLRDTLRRAVRRGRQLMSGGHLQLLR